MENLKEPQVLERASLTLRMKSDSYFQKSVRLDCIMADEMVNSPPPDREACRVDEKRSPPVVFSTLKPINGGNDSKMKTRKKRAGAARMRSYEMVDHRTTQGNVSPADPSSIECAAGHDQKMLKTANKFHRPCMNNTRSGLPGEVVGVNGQEAEYVDYPNRADHFFEAGIKSEDVNFFALHHQKSAGTNMSMNTADFSLKTQVSQLLYDNEELNHRFHQINQKNQVLTIERERLLTTIRNTSAILQSTFSTLSLDKDPDKIRYQLEERKNEKDNRIADYKSSNSDSLERSTRYTIQEFDNLLSALNGRKINKKDRRPCTRQFSKFERPAKANVSQYDIIVKWLNNKTTWRSDDESSNADVSMASSNENEGVIRDEQEEKLEQVEHHSTCLAESPPTVHSDEGDQGDMSTTDARGDAINTKGEDQGPKPVSTLEVSLHSIDHGTSECILLNTPSSVSVKKDELLSECLRNIDPTVLALVPVSSFHRTALNGQEEKTLMQNELTEELITDVNNQQMMQKPDLSNDDENYNKDNNATDEKHAEPIDLTSTDDVKIAIPLGNGTELAQIFKEDEPRIDSYETRRDEQQSPVHSITENNDNDSLQEWFVQENQRTPRLGDEVLQEGKLVSELENQSECCLQSQVPESTKLEVEERGSSHSLPEKWTALTTNDKKEFLREWLRDLRARTQLYSKKSRHASEPSVQNRTKLIECDTTTNPMDEHEEFIALCKTMMNRMDLMISRSTECQRTRPNEFLGSSSCTNVITDKTDAGVHCQSNMEALFKKKKTLMGQHIRQTFIPPDGGSSNTALEMDSASSTSSNFSLADLTTTINADLENDDQTNFQMFQKCLANLEEMNMRRTNNALTQTLIIKVLRKLMAKQFREERVNASKNGDASATNIESIKDRQ